MLLMPHIPPEIISSIIEQGVQKAKFEDEHEEMGTSPLNGFDLDLSLPAGDPDPQSRIQFTAIDVDMVKSLRLVSHTFDSLAVQWIPVRIICPTDTSPSGWKAGCYHRTKSLALHLSSLHNPFPPDLPTTTGFAFGCRSFRGVMYQAKILIIHATTPDIQNHFPFLPGNFCCRWLWAELLNIDIQSFISVASFPSLQHLVCHASTVTLLEGWPYSSQLSSLQILPNTASSSTAATWSNVRVLTLTSPSQYIHRDWSFPPPLASSARNTPRSRSDKEHHPYDPLTNGAGEPHETPCRWRNRVRRDPCAPLGTHAPALRTRCRNLVGCFSKDYVYGGTTFFKKTRLRLASRRAAKWVKSRPSQALDYAQCS